jgi:MFS family permease
VNGPQPAGGRAIPDAGGTEAKRHRLEGIGASRVVVALSVARLGDAVGNSILFIALPLYVAKLSSPWFPFPESVRVGILLSLYGLTSALLQPVMGAVSDRLGRRKPLILVGLLIMGTATMGFMAASRFTHLLFLRTLQGVGVALTIPASMALMAAGSRRETRGGSMGIYTTARMTGFTVGPLIGGFLQVHFGFNAAFVAGGAFIFLALLLVQLWVRDAPTEIADRPRRSRVFDRKLMSSGIVGAALATILMAGSFSMMTTLETQFNARLHETAFGFSIAFSALMITRLVFQVPLGRLSDRIGRRPLIVTGLLLMAPATALEGFVSSTVQLTALRLVQGLGAAAVAAPAFALAGDLATRGGEGRQMSLVTSGFGLGIATGPLLAGILAVSSFELPFLAAGVLLVVGALAAYRLITETVNVRGERDVAAPRP